MSGDDIKTNGFAKTKVAGYLKEVDKIDEWAASEYGKISAKVKDRLNDVREAAEVIGIKKTVMNATIKRHRLQRKADDVRDHFAETIGQGNPDLVDQLDNVMLAAGMDLFDAADERETKPQKKSAKSQVEQIAEAAGVKPKPAGETEH